MGSSVHLTISDVRENQILEMWKWYILIWLAAQTTILAQPMITKGIREIRQLNFDECCPCMNSETKSTNDLDSIEGAATIDACPCLSAPDSESASSIFTPALRIVEPFVRSVKEKTPKPLLNPEVGLASSVLETLQEVTDQEYQEALERDAARNVLRDTEKNLFEQETTHNPQRNVVNIILQPKGDYTDDGMMSEASHVQETRCIHSSLGKTKNFKEKKFKSSKKPLREYFSLSTAPSGQRYYDMSNSASNVQERVALPSKSNILDDLKLRSDMLKMKLFPSLKSGMLDGNTDINMPNQLSRQSDCDDFNNMYSYRTSNNKLNPDFLKATEQKNYLSSSPDIKESDNNQANDFMSSPSHIEEYFARNKELKPDEILDTKVVKSNQIPYSIENPASDNIYNTDKRFTSDLSKLQQVTSLKSEIDAKLKHEINDNFANADVMSSPSEQKVVLQTLNNNKEILNDLNKECEIFNRNNMPVYKNEPNNNVIETLIEETTSKMFRETTNNENNQIVNEDLKVDDLKNNEQSSSDFKDLETGASSDILQKTNAIKQDNDQSTFVNVNKPNESENQITNAANSWLTTTEEVVTASPNIKTDFFKTFENVKKVNEKIQAKIKSNIQNALKPNAVRDNSQPKLETTTLSIPVNNGKNVTEENNNKGNSVTTQDLQDIADNILNLSLSNKEATEPIAQDSKIVTNINANILDTEIETSRPELNNNEISNISPLQIIDPESTLSGSSSRSFDEIVQVVNKESDKTRANDNNEIIDSLSTKNLCENTEPKTADYPELSPIIEHEKEMICEASSPFVNSIPHTNHLMQSNANSNVRNFLDNVKTSISDIFNTDSDTVGSRKFDNNYDNSYRTPAFLTNGQDYFYKQPSNVPRNNIHSYRAKVASPDTLSMKTIPSLIYKGNSDAKSANEFLRNPIEVPTVSKFENFNGNYDSRFNTPTNRLNSFSENLKSRTEDTLRNVQESFDDLQKLNLNIQDNKLGESLTKPNIFRTSQPTNLSKRLQDINSDLMDRLSLMAQKIQISQAKNKINNGIKSKPKFKPQIKENVVLKNKQPSGLKPYKPESTMSKSRPDISKPYLQQNPRVLSQSREPNLKNIEYPSKLKSPLESKSPLTNKLKPKPLKENKVRFSFTTTSIRPDVLSPKTNSKMFNKSTLPSSINLPKSPSSLTSPLQKKLKPVTKLKPGDSKTLASENVTPSIALPDRKFDKFKTTYLNDDVNDKMDAATGQNIKGFILQNSLEERSPENIFSKIRNAVKAKTPSKSINTKGLDSSIGDTKSNVITDATQSASDNINTSASNVVNKPLRQNVSYKCKMVCVEDK